MQTGLSILLATAATIGLVHTLLGPDHYLPFVALAKANAWSWRKTMVITLLCGVGHIAGSVVLGLLGIGLGWAVGSMSAFESMRGSWSAWLLIGFGLIYSVWGVRRALSRKSHTHPHAHADGTVHAHAHSHLGLHTHPHVEAGRARPSPWVLFIIFVLGPCEPLIPLLLVPAAAHNAWGLMLVAGVFGAATLTAMLFATTVLLYGLSFISMRPLERWSHALAGFALLVSGGAIQWLGL